MTGWFLALVGTFVHFALLRLFRVAIMSARYDNLRFTTCYARDLLSSDVADPDPHPIRQLIRSNLCTRDIV